MSYFPPSFAKREHKTVFPIVTLILICINVGISAYIFKSPEKIAILTKYSMVPSEVAQGKEIWSLLTMMFLHADILHLAGNMLALWIFGSLVEREVKHVKFLLLYFIAGILASLFGVLFHPDLTVYCLGASGAIAGIIGACMVVSPIGKIPWWFFMIYIAPILLIFLGLMFGLIVLSITIFVAFKIFREVPAIFFIFPWAFWQVFLYSAAFQAGIVVLGIEAHIVGFIVGLLLAIILVILGSRRRKEHLPPWEKIGK